MIVADPAVTIGIEAEREFLDRLTPPVNVAEATLFALLPLLRHSTTPFTTSVELKTPPSTRIAPPRRRSADFRL